MEDNPKWGTIENVNYNVPFKLFDSDGNEINPLCSCGKRAGNVIVGMSESIWGCSSCAGYEAYKDARFVYKPPIKLKFNHKKMARRKLVI